uniref:Keratin n=2 Tax=Accipitrinae TaxID=8955 RepID=A0A663DLY9_AQUCH
MSCYDLCRPCGPTPLANSCNEPCVRQCQDSRVVIQPSPVVVTLPGPILSSFPQNTAVGSTTSAAVGSILSEEGVPINSGGFNLSGLGGRYSWQKVPALLKPGWASSECIDQEAQSRVPDRGWSCWPGFPGGLSTLVPSRKGGREARCQPVLPGKTASCCLLLRLLSSPHHESLLSPAVLCHGFILKQVERGPAHHPLPLCVGGRRVSHCCEGVPDCQLPL